MSILGYVSLSLSLFLPMCRYLLEAVLSVSLPLFFTVFLVALGLRQIYEMANTLARIM